MASSTGQTGQGLFPKQLIVMVSAETMKRIDRDAARERLSKSEVARTYLLAGMAIEDETGD